MRLQRAGMLMLGIVLVSAVLPAGAAEASGTAAQGSHVGSHVPVATVASAQRLLQIRDGIPTRQPLASALGDSLTVWYPDPSAGVVVVGVTKVTAPITAAARATWGSGVRVIQRDRPELATKVTRIKGPLRRVKVDALGRVGSGGVMPALAPYPGRLLDAQPYYGGTRIGYVVSVSGGYSITQCTAAFADSLRQMLTAGHCFPTGSSSSRGTWTAPRAGFTPAPWAVPTGFSGVTTGPTPLTSTRRPLARSHPPATSTGTRRAPTSGWVTPT